LRETLGDPRAEATTAVELAALLPEDRRRRPLERAARLAGELGDEKLAEEVRGRLEGLPPGAPEPEEPGRQEAAESATEPLAVEPERERLRAARAKGMAWLARAVLWVYERVEDRDRGR
jgi:hypothetical protein